MAEPEGADATMPEIIVQPQLSCYSYRKILLANGAMSGHSHADTFRIKTTKRHVAITALIVEQLFIMLGLPNSHVEKIEIRYLEMKWIETTQEGTDRREEKISSPEVMVRIHFRETTLCHVRRILKETSKMSAQATAHFDYSPEIETITPKDRKTVEQLMLSLFQDMRSRVEFYRSQLAECLEDAERSLADTGNWFPEKITLPAR